MCIFTNLVQPCTKDTKKHDTRFFNYALYTELGNSYTPRLVLGFRSKILYPNITVLCISTSHSIIGLTQCSANYLFQASCCSAFFG